MTSDRGESSPPAAGGPVRHIPVLRDEAVAALAVKDGGVYLDGTFGGGGYTRSILEAADASVIALDRDPAAIAAGQSLVDEFAGRLFLVQSDFARLDDAAQGLDLAPLCGVVLDIGVSSMQFDEAERGFSFRFDGPLDMRMSGQGPSAADLVNTLDEDALADLIYFYGEERASRRIARAIAHDRLTRPFASTRQLASMIARVAPAPAREIHPATRTFQALRIAVNDELGQLLGALEAAERVLAPGGRLAVVSFHSLEDRIVKQFLAARSGRGAARSRLLPGEPARPEPTFDVGPGQPVTPTEAETQANPRARSAKLRFATRTQAPASKRDEALARLVAPAPRPQARPAGRR